MKLIGLLDGVSQYVQKAVEFTAGIKDMEGYADVGMRAIITKIVPDEHDAELVQIWFDYEPFDEYNKVFEVPNYYGKDGLANLTAREAGKYESKEMFVMYAGDDIQLDEMFVFLSPAEDMAKLQEAFKQSGEQSYILWLESQALKQLK